MNKNELNSNIELSNINDKPELKDIPTLDEIREIKKSSDVYGDKALVCYFIGFTGFMIASVLMKHADMSFTLLLFMLATIIIASMSLPLLRVTIKKRREWARLRAKRKEATKIVSKKHKK